MAVLKYFLLHEDPMVRDSVGFHLYEAWSGDRDLVPLTIESCERYGELPVLHLLGFACRFIMTHRSVEATLRLLGTSTPPYAELWIATAPLELLRARTAMLERRLSPRAFSRVERRRRFHDLPARELWGRLERGASRLERGRFEPFDWEETEDLVEALSHREQPRTVLERLSQPKDDVSPFGTLFDVELAGAMALREATPRLVHLLGHDHAAVAEAAAKSLARFGHPGIVRFLRERYPGGSQIFRRRAIAVMKAVKLDVSERALLSLLDLEPSEGLRAAVFDALRFHFTARAAAALREELRRPTSMAPAEELSKALFVLSTLFGVPDGEAERFREEARGRGDDEVLFEFPRSTE